MGVVLTAIVLLALAGCTDSSIVEAGPAAKASVDDLAWFAGTWSAGGDPVTEEVWMPPASGSIMGVNRTMSGGKTQTHEYLRIEDRDDGAYYVAAPKGQAEASFRLVELEGKRAVFENLAHDFPQRLTYTRKGDALTAEVEGSGNAVTFAWKAARVDTAAVEAGARKALEDYRVAMSTGNYDQALKISIDSPQFYWAEDGRKPYKSLKHVKAAFDQLEQLGGLEVKYTDTEVTVLSADNAIVYTQHDTTLRRGGSTFSGALTINMKKTDVGWKFVAGHTSSTAPEPSVPE